MFCSRAGFFRLFSRRSGSSGRGFHPMEMEEQKHLVPEKFSIDVGWCCGMECFIWDKLKLMYACLLILLSISPFHMHSRCQAQSILECFCYIFLERKFPICLTNFFTSTLHQSLCQTVTDSKCCLLCLLPIYMVNLTRKRMVVLDVKARRSHKTKASMCGMESINMLWLFLLGLFGVAFDHNQPLLRLHQ